MKKSRFTEAQIMGVLRQAGGGMPVPELCREHGISSATFYKWRAKYGGMDASMVSQMKALEDENRRLKRNVCRSQHAGRSASRGSWKKVTRPAQRRELAEKAVAMKGVSIALACRAFGVSETCFRYSPKRDDVSSARSPRNWPCRMPRTWSGRWISWPIAWPTGGSSGS